MRIMSLNINDFGGVTEKLMGQKIVNYQGKECIDWKYWEYYIEKDSKVKEMKEHIREQNPDVVILQEYECNNSIEPKDFIAWMNRKGYEVYGNIPNYKISMTLMFSKRKCIRLSIPHKTVTANDVAIKIDDLIIYGVRIPLNSSQRPTVREDYWDEILRFCESHLEEKIILIGDFNTYDNSGNNVNAFMKKEELLSKFGVDLWLELGNSYDTPTQKPNMSRLDYVFITKNNVKGTKMSLIPENDGDFIDNEIWALSDHRMIVVDIEENNMRENDYKDRERKIYCSAMERMFPDGGETYTLEEVKRLFEEEGVNQNFEDALSKCIEDGWIIDCGNGNYTR